MRFACYSMLSHDGGTLAVRPRDLHRLRRDNGCVFQGEVGKKVMKYGWRMIENFS